MQEFFEIADYKQEEPEVQMHATFCLICILPCLILVALSLIFIFAMPGSEGSHACQASMLFILILTAGLAGYLDFLL